MKKGIVVTVALVLILGFGVVAYADSTNEAPEWFYDMMDWKREQVQEAVETGEMTEEEAVIYNERLEEMEARRVERGFGIGRGGFGACHGEGRRGFGGRMTRGMRGMMGGF